MLPKHSLSYPHGMQPIIGCRRGCYVLCHLLRLKEFLDALQVKVALLFVRHSAVKVLVLRLPDGRAAGGLLEQGTSRRLKPASRSQCEYPPGLT